MEEDSVESKAKHNDDDYETVRFPTIPVSVTADETTLNKTKGQHVFRPANVTLAKGRHLSKRNSTVAQQVVRLRGSRSQSEGFLEMQLIPGSWGMVCDKRNKWNIQEAHLVCRTLGFPRYQHHLYILFCFFSESFITRTTLFMRVSNLEPPVLRDAQLWVFFALLANSMLTLYKNCNFSKCAVIPVFLF